MQLGNADGASPMDPGGRHGINSPISKACPKPRWDGMAARVMTQGTPKQLVSQTSRWTDGELWGQKEDGRGPRATVYGG